jgi:probable HAF family extracellular repeat protein
MSELAPPGTGQSQATGINERGGVIGVTTRHGRDRAFYWRNERWTRIESLSPFANPPLAINDRGQVLGRWKERHSWRGHFRRWNWRGYVWQSGRSVDLGTLGGEYTRARAMNERGQVVGESETPTELADHAFLWERGRLRDLGTLGGRHSGATAINDSGVIVGWSQTHDGDWHGFRWRRGRMEDLGPECVPAFIANSGLIVGTDQGEDRPCVIASRGVSWLPGRYAYIDLNAVNEEGQIVGTAQRTFSSPSRAVVWERKR